MKRFKYTEIMDALLTPAIWYLVLVLITANLSLTGSWHAMSIPEKFSWRNTRSRGHYLDSGTRFGWQNPILVAPTLPTYHKYPNANAPTPTPASRQNQHHFRPRPTLASSTSNQHSASYPNRPMNPSKGLPHGPFMPTTSKYDQPPSPTTNDKVTDSESEISRRQCPVDHRRNKETKQCHRLGATNVCNENMAFYEDPTNREFGQCDCIQDDFTRPLFYHRETDKCYFIFQQAFCDSGKWLAMGSELPACEDNPCIQWVKNTFSSNWNWEENGYSLDKNGPVPLLKEQTCTILGWPCTEERKEGIREVLLDRRPMGERGPQVTLKFEGTNLVCSRESFVHFQQSDNTLACKQGLYNKWRLDGKCKN